MLKCNYAWGHLDFKKGHYAPCFRFDIGSSPMPKNSNMLPSDALNSAEFKDVRKQLQAGIFPAGCADCKYKEETGLKSYRQQSIEAGKFKTITPDYTSLEVTELAELELKFSRKCNFLCRHCDAQSNDAFEVLGKNNIEIEKKLKDLDFEHISVPRNAITNISDDNIQNIIDNVVPITKSIFFSGGEPLFHAAHYEFLIKLISDPAIDTTKITLGYNTNFSIIKFKNYNLFELWKNFKNINITVSLDGTGEVFNYFREKGNYSEVVSNISTALTQATNISSMLFVCTCSSYHALYAEEIFTDITNLINHFKTLSPDTRFSTKPTFVHYPKGLDMVNLSDDTKQIIIDRLTTSLTVNNNYFYQISIKEIIKALGGKRSLPLETFKEIVKVQDELYKKDSKNTCPKIYNYVYNSQLI